MESVRLWVIVTGTGRFRVVGVLADAKTFLDGDGSVTALRDATPEELERYWATGSYRL
ncbi:MAG: hypothetical protein PHR35_22945 [Kiritimatiellae bacterium]|nr:hypothetical protein [Kiritimatiellia bacterium]